MADVAFTFHFSLDDLWALDGVELLFWHSQVVRIHESK
jgi:hypothetical protein